MSTKSTRLLPTDFTTPSYGSTQESRSNNDTSAQASESLGGNHGLATSEERLLEEAVMEKPVSKKRLLGTFDGVFVPTCLNTLSILMFLRFGFILGQCGILGMFGMLVASYGVNLLTTMSVSAVSSNGTVRGGGAYYLISRTLGPEFGGSIGLVFYLGQVLNTGMNAAGLVSCIMTNYGLVSGTATKIFPESTAWNYLYSSIILWVCTIMSFFGSALFAKASNALLVILMISTLSIPFSTFFLKPFADPDNHVLYTGLSWRTFKQNMWPSFAPDANGKTEDWASLFGILFPATAGIFAGASMSGDLRKPSKSIPKGTLHSLIFTFSTYALVIFFMGASVSRITLHKDLDVIQDINASPHLILMGELSTSFFSTLMGVVGAAKCLQALARDGLYPGFGIFAGGTKNGDEPIAAIILTLALSQITLLADINQIAAFVTMTFLMTFFGTNLACFLLKLSSAPNFRPSFQYFTWWTAASGVALSGVTMFLVDGASASGCVLFLIFLFLLVHYTSPPKSWGDVSQSLIYHQVRKYLLRLKQEHVKFWRPQILLLVNDPRRSWKLIQFCNSMKKGGLYILGHVIVTADFQESFPELKRQQAAWLKYIDFTRIKAFVQVAVAPTLEWGARNAVISAGLGGMRPNIAVLGFFNLDEYRTETGRLMPLSKIKSLATDAVLTGELPTDVCRSERAVGVTSYVNVLEDLLLSLQMNVAIARGFPNLEIPTENGEHSKKYIDLWPIQMTAEIETAESESNVLTTNFDTYTLILQLGCILNTVPSWKKTYKLRVCVFVEYESDVQDEYDRVKKLLENLRIQAELHVFYLAKGDLKIYQSIIHGHDAGNEEEHIDSVLGEEQWWQEMKKHRMQSASATDIKKLVREGLWSESTFHQGPAFSQSRDLGLRKILGSARARNRRSISGLHHFAGKLSFSMRKHASPAGFDSASSDDESSSDSDDHHHRSALTDDDDSTASSHPSRNRRASTGNALDFFRRSRPKPNSTESDPLLVSPTNITAHPSYMGHPSPPLNESSPPHNLPSTPSPTPLPASTTNLPLPPKRPEPKHRKTAPMFTSRAMPDTIIPTSESSGPSIRFLDPPAPRAAPPSTTLPPTIPASLAPSFNDLPSLGQHIIINELIRRNSADTAVVFTTLPAMPPGTWREEADSVEYLRGLEVLTEGVGPCLLVHSNSLTVTTAL